MKIFAITDNCRNSEEKINLQKPGWVFLPDSAIFRAPNPFFLDDEEDEAVAFPSLALRVDRIGKSISPRFASRYVTHAALAVNFRNITLQNKLAEAGSPTIPAWGYDRSLLLSDWHELSLSDIESLLIVIQELREEPDDSAKKFVSKWEFDKIILTVPEIISEISKTNILKMGDIILPGFPTDGLRLHVGSRLKCEIQKGTEVLDSITISIR